MGHNEQAVGLFRAEELVGETLISGNQVFATAGLSASTTIQSATVLTISGGLILASVDPS